MKQIYRYIGMNENQIRVINQFTKFRAARTTEKEMVKIIENEEGTWVYGGYIDTGKFGKGKCSLGHAVRYEHIAINTKTGKQIIFGINCISDFFNISPEKIDMINHNFVQTNKMVDQIVDRFRSKYDISKDREKLKYILENSNLYEREMNSINEIQYIKLLLNEELPLPNYYSSILDAVYSTIQNIKRFNSSEKNDEFIGVITMAELTKDNLKILHPEIYTKVDDMLGKFKKYKNLSDKQMYFLKKLVMMPFDKIDDLIAKIKLFKREYFLVIKEYDEYEVFLNLVDAYNHYGISEKQVNLLEKIYRRCNGKYMKENPQ